MIADSVAISLVGAGATVAVSLVNAIFSLIGNQRGKRNEDHLVQTKSAVEKLTVQTDGMQTKLLQVTGESERAKGVLVGHAEEKAESVKCQYQGEDKTCRYPVVDGEK